MKVTEKCLDEKMSRVWRPSGFWVGQRIGWFDDLEDGLSFRIFFCKIDIYTVSVAGEWTRGFRVDNVPGESVQIASGRMAHGLEAPSKFWTLGGIFRIFSRDYKYVLWTQ